MAKQDKKKKIALVGYKLAKGGLERVLSSVSHLLYDADCDVHVIVLENEIEYSYSGTLINLGYFSKYEKYFQLRKQLKKNQFDCIIDFRHRINPWMELVFLYFIYANFKTIYTIHSSKLAVYLTHKRFVTNQILKKANKIVTVSKGLNDIIKKEFHFDKSVVIPNSITEKREVINCNDTQISYKYCIAVGRLVALKQFDQLIKVYSESHLPQKHVHLIILGEGEEKERLQRLIFERKMTEFIHLLGFKTDVFCYIENAEFLVLTSKYEGFSMVILEALDLSTPVISFDCEVGPRELIKHEHNGLLIENQNFESFKEALNRMVQDDKLKEFCATNAKASVNDFTAKNIQKKWLHLVNNNNN